MENKSKKKAAPKQSSVTMERCPKCFSMEFSIETGPHQKRYCQKCKHVWIPMSQAELELTAMKQDYGKLKDAYDRLKAEYDKLAK